MRREDFSVEVSNDNSRVGETAVPTLRIVFDGEPAAVERRIDSATERSLESDHVDVTYRLNDDPAKSDATGVVALTNRLTGDYVLEVVAPAATVRSLVRAVREHGEHSSDDAEYHLTLVAGDDQLVALEKRTLLVYGPGGELLRNHSLIPSGVEI